MTAERQTSLAVALRDLPALDLVCLSCQVDQAAGEFNTTIQRGFEQIKQWAKQQSGADADQLIIGIPHVVDRQLVSYDCCVRVPHGGVSLPAGWEKKQLTGGSYAVLTLDKDSATIGEQIGKFFAEYAPQHQLAIDPARPSYEIYYARTMDYCVPLLAPHN